MTFDRLRLGQVRRRRSFAIARARRAGATIAAAAVALSGASAVVWANLSSAAGPIVNGFEVPTISDTAYAIPAGALFVAPSGSDSSPGTLAAPFLTVAKAVQAAPSGATIVLRAGTYREALGSVIKKITLQAYPHEQAWMKGSQVVTGFAAAGSQWVRTGWKSSLCRNCYTSDVIDPAYPAAGLPDQVFVDGTPQQQVTSRAAAGAGKFFVDTANSQLVLGSDPTGHTIEATAAAAAIQFNNASAAGSAIRGIGFQHYGATETYAVPGMVTVNAPNVTLDHDTFAYSAGRGVALASTGTVFTDNLLLNNGFNGVNANRADGLDFERNRVAFSNFEHFNINPNIGSVAVAGAKITTTRNAVFIGNLFEDNNSNGLWFDISCYNTVVANNTVLRNGRHGIAIEISGTTVVAGNVSAQNAADGLKISGSTDVDAYNNTLVGNGWAQLGVYEDRRSNTNQAERALGITWDTARVSVVNNVIVGFTTSARPMLNSFDQNAPKQTTTGAMMPVDNHNVWGRTTVTAPKFVAVWAGAANSAAYPTLAGLQSGTGREQGSTAIDNIVLTGMFTNPGAGDYRLVGAVATTSAPLPPNVAAAMGIAGSYASNVGALTAPLAFS